VVDSAHPPVLHAQGQVHGEQLARAPHADPRGLSQGAVVFLDGWGEGRAAADGRRRRRLCRAPADGRLFFFPPSHAHQIPLDDKKNPTNYLHPYTTHRSRTSTPFTATSSTSSTTETTTSSR
jgi:hypothetical protein